MDPPPAENMNIRIWAYMIVGAIILLVCFCVCYCNDRSGERSITRQESEPAGEDQIGIPPDSVISNLSPPSYADSISVHRDDDVPSYEDVIANSDSYVMGNLAAFSGADIESANNIDSIACNE